MRCALGSSALTVTALTNPGAFCPLSRRTQALTGKWLGGDAPNCGAWQRLDSLKDPSCSQPADQQTLPEQLQYGYGYRWMPFSERWKKSHPVGLHFLFTRQVDPLEAINSESTQIKKCVISLTLQGYVFSCWVSYDQIFSCSHLPCSLSMNLSPFLCTFYMRVHCCFPSYVHSSPASSFLENLH